MVNGGGEIPRLRPAIQRRLNTFRYVLILEKSGAGGGI
jgi:hypothetical protein